MNGIPTCALPPPSLRCDCADGLCFVPVHSTCSIWGAARCCSIPVIAVCLGASYFQRLLYHNATLHARAQQLGYFFQQRGVSVCDSSCCERLVLGSCGWLAACWVVFVVGLARCRAGCAWRAWAVGMRCVLFICWQIQIQSSTIDLFSLAPPCLLHHP